MKYFYAFIILTVMSDISAAGLSNLFNDLSKKPVATPQPTPQAPAPKPPAAPVKK